MDSSAAFSIPPPIPHDGRITLDGLWTEAWALMKANYVLLLLATVVALLASGLPLFLDLWIPWLGTVVAFLAASPLQAGLYYLGVRLARGPHPGFEDLFAGYGRYWTVLAVAFVEQCISLLGQLPQLFKSMGSGRPDVGVIFLACGSSILCLIVIVFFTIRLALASTLCVDPYSIRHTAAEAMARSWRLTGPNFWTIFLFFLLIGLILFGSLLLLGVGLIFLGFPFYICAFGVMYTRIVGPLPHGVCLHCGYDTSASPSPLCPECGGATGVRLPPPILGAGPG